MTRTNRLAGELSPYLLQHAENPVDWYPWGEEALELARERAMPIFLSIGYSACHWCHVMEAESFTNEGIAALLSEHFVCIKVDREELPEVDELYMRAVQSLTGSGGWPLSVFLTPERTPFFGGTYFPPYSAHGRPGFFDVVQGIARGWSSDPGRALEVGRKLQRELAQEAAAQTAGPLPPDVRARAISALAEGYDTESGGFGLAPKFPHATDLRLCLRHGRREGGEQAEAATGMAVESLRAMARGGLWDQVGGGFHRYCVDEHWLVPHFEKMLYDSALLVPAYLEAFLVTGDEDLARVARGACDWMLADLRLPEGGFASSLDADSGGEEGTFYTWTPDELTSLLGTSRGYRAQEWFGVEEGGHLEDGRSVLHRPGSPEEVAQRIGCGVEELERDMVEATATLRIARRRRLAPARDDKVLTSWNGLAISALAQASQVLGVPAYARAAQEAARFVLGALQSEEGSLLACWRGGRARHPAGLEAYSYLIQGLVDLYETDFDSAWLGEALRLSLALEERFGDKGRGGYFLTAEGRRDLLVRLKGPIDGALPAPASVHALSLLRLAELTARRELAEKAQGSLLAHGQLVAGYPAGFSQLLIAADYLEGVPLEVVIAGPRGHASTEALLAAVRGTFRPGRVVALTDGAADEALQPLLGEKPPPAGGGALAYPCRGYTCQAPISDPGELRAWLLA